MGDSLPSTSNICIPAANKEKKIFVITPDQFAKLGLSSKIKTIVTPSLQKNIHTTGKVIKYVKPQQKIGIMRSSESVQTGNSIQAKLKRILNKDVFSQKPNEESITSTTKSIYKVQPIKAPLGVQSIKLLKPSSQTVNLNTINKFSKVTKTVIKDASAPGSKITYMRTPMRYEAIEETDQLNTLDDNKVVLNTNQTFSPMIVRKQIQPVKKIVQQSTPYFKTFSIKRKIEIIKPANDVTTPIITKQQDSKTPLNVINTSANIKTSVQYVPKAQQKFSKIHYDENPSDIDDEDENNSNMEDEDDEEYEEIIFEVEPGSDEEDQDRSHDYDQNVMEDSYETTDVSTTEVKIPKKRGRKPLTEEEKRKREEDKQVEKERRERRRQQREEEKLEREERRRLRIIGLSQGLETNVQSTKLRPEKSTYTVRKRKPKYDISRIASDSDESYHEESDEDYMDDDDFETVKRPTKPGSKRRGRPPKVSLVGMNPLSNMSIRQFKDSDKMSKLHLKNIPLPISSNQTQRTNQVLSVSSEKLKRKLLTLSGGDTKRIRMIETDDPSKGKVKVFVIMKPNDQPKEKKLNQIVLNKSNIQFSHQNIHVPQTQKEPKDEHVAQKFEIKVLSNSEFTLIKKDEYNNAVAMNSSYAQTYETIPNEPIQSIANVQLLDAQNFSFTTNQGKETDCQEIYLDTLENCDQEKPQEPENYLAALHEGTYEISSDNVQKVNLQQPEEYVTALQNFTNSHEGGYNVISQAPEDYLALHDGEYVPVNEIKNVDHIESYLEHIETNTETSNQPNDLFNDCHRLTTNINQTIEQDMGITEGDSVMTNCHNEQNIDNMKQNIDAGILSECGVLEQTNVMDNILLVYNKGSEVLHIDANGENIQSKSQEIFYNAKHEHFGIEETLQGKNFIETYPGNNYVEVSIENTTHMNIIATSEKNIYINDESSLNQEHGVAPDDVEYATHMSIIDNSDKNGFINDGNALIQKEETVMDNDIVDTSEQNIFITDDSLLTQEHVTPEENIEENIFINNMGAPTEENAPSSDTIEDAASMQIIDTSEKNVFIDNLLNQEHEAPAENMNIMEDSTHLQIIDTTNNDDTSLTQEHVTPSERIDGASSIDSLNKSICEDLLIQEHIVPSDKIENVTQLDITNNSSLIETHSVCIDKIEDATHLETLDSTEKNIFTNDESAFTQEHVDSLVKIDDSTHVQIIERNVFVNDNCSLNQENYLPAVYESAVEEENVVGDLNHQSDEKLEIKDCVEFIELSQGINETEILKENHSMPDVQNVEINQTSDTCENEDLNNEYANPQQYTENVTFTEINRVIDNMTNVNIENVGIPQVDGANDSDSEVEQNTRSNAKRKRTLKNIPLLEIKPKIHEQLDPNNTVADKSVNLSDCEEAPQLKRKRGRPSKTLELDQTENIISGKRKKSTVNYVELNGDEQKNVRRSRRNVQNDETVQETPDKLEPNKNSRRKSSKDSLQNETNRNDEVSKSATYKTKKKSLDTFEDKESRILTNLSNADQTREEFLKEKYSQGYQMHILAKELGIDIRKISENDNNDTNPKYCMICKKNIEDNCWAYHKTRYHNNLAWRFGEKPFPLNNSEAIIFALNVIYKQSKQFHCELCDEKKKSIWGFLTHRVFCRKDKEQLEHLLEECPECKQVMYTTSLVDHINTHKKSLKKKKENRSSVKPAVAVVSSTRKRVAAERASLLIKNVTKDTNTDDTNSQTKEMFYKHPFTSNMIDVPFEEELEDNSFIKCKYNSCNTKSNNKSDALDHLNNCSLKTDEICLCKHCNIFFNAENDIRKHMKQKHPEDFDVEYKEETYAESDDANSDENFDDSTSLTKFKSSDSRELKGKVYCLKFLKKLQSVTHAFGQEAFMLNLNFCIKNHSKKLYNNFSLKMDHWKPVDPKLINEYLPPMKNSIQFDESIVFKIELKRDFKTESYQRLKLFQSLIGPEGNCTIFCGGPISAMSWLPTPFEMENCNQILAVAVLPNMNINYNNIKQSKGLIQFWNFGTLLLKKMNNFQPKLEFCIAHDLGSIRCMEWCPSGCYNTGDVSERWGLLAVGSGDIFVNIYCIGRSQNNLAKVFHTKSILKLMPYRFCDSQLGQKRFCVTRISWANSKGHKYIAVGYSNGFVALFHLETSNTNSNADIIYPTLIFQAHLDSVTGLSLYHLNEGKRWLATSSIDRQVKIWDLCNLHLPISSTRHCFVKQIIWLNNYVSLLEAYDDNLAIYGTNLTQLRNFASPPNTSISYSHSGVNSISVSNWSNIFIHGNEMGEVIAATCNCFPFQSNDIQVARHFCSYIKTKIIDESVDKSYMELASYNGVNKYYALTFANISSKIPKKLIKDATSCRGSYNYPDCNIYPIECINVIAVNPNRYSYHHTAVGYQAGFVRVLHTRVFS